MGLRLCQLKSRTLLCLILLQGCALFSDQKPIVQKDLLANITPSWFTQNPSHALWDREGKPQAHGYFDVNVDQAGNLFNVILLTPESSSYNYEYDVPSGRRYYSHTFCPQRDVWNRVSNSIWKPNYTTAIIPGYMDQMAEPQRVLIFSSRGFFNRFRDDHYHRVKIIGAMVNFYCHAGNCLGKTWDARMIFLAVDPEDPNYASVNSPEELYPKVDWPQTIANIENLEGRNGTTSANYPAVRAGQAVPFAEALEFHKKYSIKLGGEEVKKIQKSCFNLYDKLWEEVGKELPEDKVAKTTEELKAKLKLREELKKKKKPVGFAARLRAYTKKYFPEISTCNKFVYSGNVNQDPDKFWFLAQMTMFYRLHQDGYFFDCNVKTWQKNYRNSDGELFHDLKRDIFTCTDKDIDVAMNYMPSFLKGIKGAGEGYYRFIEYDGHGFGTHGKIYSWVKTKTRTFDCSYDPNESIREKIQVYPEDIVWRSRDVVDSEKAKVIY